MTARFLLPGAVLLLLLGGCAGKPPQPEAELPSPPQPGAELPAPPQPEAALPASPPPIVEDLSSDRTIVPGERVGPVFLDASLRELVQTFGEPVESAASRVPGGRPALLYRYADPDASPEGSLQVLVREHDQTVYSIRIEGMDSFRTPEGVRVGSSEALVRASYGKPQSTSTLTAVSGGTTVSRVYCYLIGLAVDLSETGTVESLTVFPGPDLRKICKAP